MLLPDFIDAVTKGAVGKEAVETLTKIPVIGTLVAAAKAVGTFHDAYLLHKWMVFQKQFRNGQVAAKELTK